jgi:hypothetical protein
MWHAFKLLDRQNIDERTICVYWITTAGTIDLQHFLKSRSQFDFESKPRVLKKYLTKKFRSLYKLNKFSVINGIIKLPQCTIKNKFKENYNLASKLLTLLKLATLLGLPVILNGKMTTCRASDCEG